jgi:hypothetical protein
MCTITSTDVKAAYTHQNDTNASTCREGVRMDDHADLMREHGMGEVRRDDCAEHDERGHPQSQAVRLEEEHRQRHEHGEHGQRVQDVDHGRNVLDACRHPTVRAAQTSDSTS